jgi:exopolyphosphatase / guanosine-5'-triphosphate,3'-diphosphate pyrophosphatase
MMPQIGLGPARAGRERLGSPQVRCACIDIGSNTTRLLVADVHDGALEPVLEERAFTQLAGACGGGTLPAAALAALAEVVASQAREAREQGARELRVVGTAALRRAANGHDACAALSAAAGVPVELLSAEEEARLAFAGATGAVPPARESSILVADVGGGSTQLVAGTGAGNVAWSVSLPLGSGDLAAAHLHADPPSAAELDALVAAVEGTLDGLAVPPAERRLAVGGSATSLRRLAGPSLDRQRLAQALAALTAEPVAVAAARWEIAPERVRLLPAGIAVLAALAERAGPLEIACGGLREGVVRALAA